VKEDLVAGLVRNRVDLVDRLPGACGQGPGIGVVTGRANVEGREDLPALERLEPEPNAIVRRRRPGGKPPTRVKTGP
jgi:hypothetical protein